MKTINFAGICVLITGIGHTAIHLMMSIFGNHDPELVKVMTTTKINIINERSLLDYHNGFSLAMGVLIIGLGIQILQNKQLNSKPILLNHLIITGTISVISIIYFHPGAMALMTTSFILLTLAYRKISLN